MDVELTALHCAVKALLKARREAKRAAKALARAGSGFGPRYWDMLPFYDELSRGVDYTENLLKETEAEVLISWEALHYLPEPPTNKPIP